MSRASRARAVVQAAAVGGAGLVGVGGAFYGLLLTQARLARRRIGEPTEAPHDPNASYGDDATDPVRIAVLGDSSAAGFGVPSPELTTGALIAQGLADVMQRSVELTSVAVVGAQSGHLAGQVDSVMSGQPHAAVIMIGANDVTHKVTPGRSVALLVDAVRRLRAADVEVVVGTCPDLGTIRPIPHPLKWVARRWSRSLAAAQTVGVVEAGGRTVALADLLGPEFDAYPDRMFGLDRFHPSQEGYQAMASAIVPSLHAALSERMSGLGTPDAVAEPTTVLSIDRAAVVAAETGGTEVAATHLPARRNLRGHRRLLAALRLRGPRAAGQGQPTTTPQSASGFDEPARR